jgi:prepilin-type N-terminal cleavage/methylation domain-containing protein
VRNSTERHSEEGCKSGSAVVCLGSSCCVLPSRTGFALIEVLVALVIIGLAGLGLASFSIESYRATQNLTVRATAENLAEVTLEELGSMASSTLSSMTHSSGYFSINFPENGHVVDDPEALDVAEHDASFNSTTNLFDVTDGVYHVLCDGQLLLGTYSGFFDGTGEPGSRGGSGAVVKVADGTSDLFMTSLWTGVVAVTGPLANDYCQVYNLSQVAILPSADTSDYNVYKYQLGSDIYLEPINIGTTMNPRWQAVGLLVFASAAPHLYREVTIADVSTPTSAGRYDITVRVIWTFGGVRQLVEVTGGRTDLR